MLQTPNPSPSNPANDPSSCFAQSFVAEFEAAVQTLPSGYCQATWASGERGLVAALVGPPRDAFVLAQEEGRVWLIDKQASQKIEVGTIGQVSGEMVVARIREVLTRRGLTG